MCWDSRKELEVQNIALPLKAEAGTGSGSSFPSPCEHRVPTAAGAGLGRPWALGSSRVVPAGRGLRLLAGGAGGGQDAGAVPRFVPGEPVVPFPGTQRLLTWRPARRDRTLFQLKSLSPDFLGLHSLGANVCTFHGPWLQAN